MKTYTIADKEKAKKLSYARMLERNRNWRKTPRGVLTDIYNHMTHRNEVAFSLADFHERYLEDAKFLRLHMEWEKSGYQKLYKPSVDRIDSFQGYTMRNCNMMTWGENQFKRDKTDGKRNRSAAVIQLLDGVEVNRFRSQYHAVKSLGITQANMSAALSGKRKTAGGFGFQYVLEEVAQKFGVKAVKIVDKD